MFATNAISGMSSNSKRNSVWRFSPRLFCCALLIQRQFRLCGPNNGMRCSLAPTHGAKVKVCLSVPSAASASLCASFTGGIGILLTLIERFKMAATGPSLSINTHPLIPWPTPS